MLAHTDCQRGMKKGFFMQDQHTTPPPPKVGDSIYVPSEAYCRYGIGDFIGGRAVVSAVTNRMNDGEVVSFVTVSVFPFRHYDWRQLSQEQATLREEFKETEAHSGALVRSPLSRCA